MNITHVASDPVIEGCKLTAIFDGQRKLMDKYLPIEIRNGLRWWKSHEPVDLDDRFGQAQVKDFCWRVTEELAEADEAANALDEPVEHAQEEIADVLHFLTELMIMADVTPEQLVLTSDQCRLEAMFELADNGPGAFDVICSLGLAANCLKNKPWKNTHMPTDKLKFLSHLAAAFWNFISYARAHGFTAETLSILYHRKHTVNQFRQASNY